MSAVKEKGFSSSALHLHSPENPLFSIGTSYSVLFTQPLSCEKSLFFNLLFYSQKVRNCWNANT